MTIRRPKRHIRGNRLSAHHRSNETLRYLLASILFVFIILPAPAFSTPVSIEYFLGFNDLFPLNRWGPLNVILENRGKATSGKLEVKVVSGSEYKRDLRESVYSMDAELPANSRKLYSFSILIESFVHPLTISLRNNEENIQSVAVDLRNHYTEKGLILLLGSGPATGSLTDLSDNLLPVALHARFLPESWYGYSGVDMLILDTSVLAHLRERQFSALIDWIKRGGYVVTSANLNYGSFLKERSLRLLPITIKGLKRLSELTSLEEFCGQGYTGTYPFFVLDAEVAESTPVLQQDDITIISLKNIGMGKVAFIAFDCMGTPFTEWQGRIPFWRRILDMKPSPYYSGTLPEEQKILSFMISEIPVGFPSFWSAVLFLVLYLILVRLVLKIIGKKGVKQWKRFSYLTTVILMSAGIACYLFCDREVQKDLSYNSFLRLKLSGQEMIATSRHIIGVYSLKKKACLMDLGDALHPITVIPSDQAGNGTLHSLTLDDSNGKRTALLSMDRFSHRLIKMDSMIDLPILGGASMEDRELVLMVDNRSPHRIADCMIYFNGRVIGCGEITPNQRQVKRLSIPFTDHGILPRDGGRDPVKNGERQGSFTEKMRKEIMGDLQIAMNALYDSERGSIYMMGWILPDMGPIVPRPTGISGKEATLLEWEIPLIPGSDKARSPQETTKSLPKDGEKPKLSGN